jgi:hypothetical protein
MRLLSALACAAALAASGFAALTPAAAGSRQAAWDDRDVERAAPVVIYDDQPGVVVRPYWRAPWRYRHYYPHTGVIPRLGRDEDLTAGSIRPRRAQSFHREWSTSSGATRETPADYPYVRCADCGGDAGGRRVINTTRIVRDPPVVVETRRVVDDPPRVIVRRHVIEDATAPAGQGRAARRARDKGPAHDAGRRARAEAGWPRVIHAEAEVTILGPDRMNIRLFRQRPGSDAEAAADGR